MELFDKNVPDDLNEWAKETFKDINRLFRMASGLDKREENVIPKSEFGKSNRETIIEEDDILNLKIELGSVETIDEFLERM